jgi:hypothetical protein
MEQNREVKDLPESPDSWRERLRRATRPHGRFAVISSSATIGALLLLGGIVFANQGSDKPDDLGSPARSTVSTTFDGDGAPSAASSTTITSTTALGSSATTIPDSGPSGTGSTNTTSGSTGGQTGGTSPTTLPSTTSPTTVAGGVTTTTARTRAPNGPQIPSLLADAIYSADDPVLNLKISAGDKDGYVSRVVINWDDGSKWSVIDYPLASCNEPLNTLVTPNERHTYSEAGSYTVTITVSSVNCVGDGVQQTITTKQVTVGGMVTTTTAPTTTTTAAP